MVLGKWQVPFWAVEDFELSSQYYSGVLFWFDLFLEGDKSICDLNSKNYCDKCQKAICEKWF